MRASDGLEVTHVTDDLATNLTPSWSPDGRSIVYSHHDGEIFVSPNQLVSLTGLADVYDRLVARDGRRGHRAPDGAHRDRATRPGGSRCGRPRATASTSSAKGPTPSTSSRCRPTGGDVQSAADHPVHQRDLDRLEMTVTGPDPDLTTVIVNWNTVGLLDDCIQSLVDHLPPGVTQRGHRRRQRVGRRLGRAPGPRAGRRCR